MIKRLISLMVCAALLTFGLLQTVAAAEMTLGEAINKAGRQRMLTQRIVKTYCQMGQDVRYLVAEEQLKGSIALFESQLLELQAFSKDGETQRGLKLVEQLWSPVKAAATGQISRDQAEGLRADAEKLLVAAHQVVLLLEDQSKTPAGRLVNISGRQRMLSQRMSNLYMLMSWGFENTQYQADYNKAVEEFESALKELRSAPSNTPAISRKLTEVSQNWDMFKLSFRLDSKTYVPGLVVRMLDKILVQMNEITGLYAELPAS